MELPGPNGVDAPGAWGNLAAAGAPGGEGVTVACSTPASPTPADRPARLSRPRRPTDRPGYDFVDNDPDPYDVNGHGTHVASIIAEQTNNDYGLTGLAYGVDLMPVRVLDRSGKATRPRSPAACGTPSITARRSSTSA